MIRPGTEHQLRRCFRGPPPPRRPIPQFYGGLSQVIHCILCKRGFDGQESFVTHQREAHSRGATVSPTIHKRAGVIHSTGAGPLGAPRVVYYRDELTNYVIGAESAAEAETEFVIQQDIRSNLVKWKKRACLLTKCQSLPVVVKTVATKASLMTLRSLRALPLAKSQMIKTALLIVY
ncbi:hypothetical protein BKA61DRAFT_207354 [Leptodontidium sp. MPI-SDFR-AT-0119]|nr:hypothetical protein BKA61DRAFT_207354 [Leptodontidium sp. MPI-SDFR-AT-0119]